MNIGSRIREIRERQGLTVTRLAELSGVSKAYISQLESPIENGETEKKVSADILFKLATALGTTMAVLMGKEVPVLTKADIPESLKRFAEKNKLNDEEITMLAGISYRGKQPTDEKDWGYILNTIRTAVKE